MYMVAVDNIGMFYYVNLNESSSMHIYIRIYFIVSGEISVYLVKIKVVSITSEMISYHFTSD